MNYWPWHTKKKLKYDSDIKFVDGKPVSKGGKAYPADIVKPVKGNDFYNCKLEEVDLKGGIITLQVFEWPDGTQRAVLAADVSIAENT